MKPLRDPGKAELKHLIEACPLTGKRVLEIGSGDGIFTRQYANLVRQVVGIDPVVSEVQAAVKKDQRKRAKKMLFLVGEGETLPFPHHIFDIVIFASSL